MKPGIRRQELKLGDTSDLCYILDMQAQPVGYFLVSQAAGFSSGLSAFVALNSRTHFEDLMFVFVVKLRRNIPGHSIKTSFD
jgi:hypothetical protein